MAAGLSQRMGAGRLPFPRRRLEYAELILLAGVIGVLAAFGNLGLRELIRGFSWLFLEQEGGLLGIRHGLGRLLTPIPLLSGGVAVLVLDYLYPGDVLGYGFPNFLETVNLGNARLRRRWIFLKTIGAALSLGCGASVGREGPIAQIGGAIGSAVAGVGKLAVERRKVLVAAGAGAGIATTFNAPMGGMMFAQEIVLLGETDLGNLTLILIATFSAVVTSRALIGGSALFQPAHFTIDNYWEMLTYGAMGLVLGAIAAFYIRFFHGMRRIISRIPIGKAGRLLAGLAIVGLIAAPLPFNLSDGYPVIELSLQGQLVLSLTAALTIAKLFTSVVSLDCGAPGGVFGPVFFIGAMAGATFRGFANTVVPGLTGPAGSYALVGLGGFLSGVTHAPLTALLLLFEMTRGDWTIVLPAMITAITALIVASAIEHESIDTYSLALEGKDLTIGRDRLLLAQLPVNSAIRRDVRTIPADASIAEVLRAAGETAQATLPVLGRDGGLAGLIVMRDLLTLIAENDYLGPLVNAWDVSRQNPPLLTLDSNLDQAAQSMEYEGLDELPVVDKGPEAKFLGLVARHDIARAFNRVSLSVSAFAPRDDSIFWASGYRVARMIAPAALIGRTLRQLDARTRFGVSVLAVQDPSREGDGFMPASADRPFKQGDMIIVAGSSGGLRRFNQELNHPTATDVSAER
jgi:CIC family chloride channel protein